ncbi:hypothetical protein ACOMHN_005724 [Nucella lapillus]
MAQKQQVLINLLNKYVRQYFIFKKKDKRKPANLKVLMRNEVHCVEEPASKEIRLKQLDQRYLDNRIGQMTPHYMAYEPVSGWPVLRLEELVLNALEQRLDPKIWQAMKSHFEKGEVKRMVERKDLGEALKDLTVVFKCQTAGYHRIKAHMAETEARMHSVKAGFDYQQHLVRTIEERHKRETPKQAGVQKFSADPDVVVAKRRVRNDTVRFLATVLDVLEKLMLLKVRHLRSPVPIVLHHLGTEKDKENSRQTDRVLQFPGGPPVTHNFREQSYCSSLLPEEQGTMMSNKFFQDKELVDAFRKRWPPIWMSLAAQDQGYNIVDPQCPTRDVYSNNQPTVPRKKSMSNILATRDEWATLREALDKSVKETLWREDKERLEFFHKQYASLSYLPLAKPYPTHKRHMNQLLAQTRTSRQEKTIYDCELSNWYKYLVIKVQEEVGKCDKEVNHLLEKVKHYFKMSPTAPRYVKAKLALVTMSLPAHVLTRIYVQRALRFLICHVLQAPETMLIGWLACRGLPFILLSSHTI